jgi:hypothetical protein
MVGEIHHRRLWAVARRPRCGMTIATPRRSLAPARPDRAFCFTDADGRLCMNACPVLRISIPREILGRHRTVRAGWPKIPVRDPRPWAFRSVWFWRNARPASTCWPMPDHFGMTTAGLARSAVFLHAVLRLGAYDPCLRPCREQTRPGRATG